MYAIYKNEVYYYVSNKSRHGIITRRLSKIASDFIHDGNCYYKKLSDNELSDIYDVEFLVEYDCGIPNISPYWSITCDDLLENDTVRLTFDEGFLPGWEIEDKTVCTKIVSQQKLASAKIKYIFNKMNGENLSEPKIMEKTIPLNTLINLCIAHSDL